MVYFAPKSGKRHKMNQIYKVNYLVYSILFLMFLTACPALVDAVNIKGTVVDAETKEPVIGAIVHLSANEVSLTTVTNLEGGYLFKDLNEGAYAIKCQYIGYRVIDSNISVQKNNRDNIAFDDKGNYVLDFSLMNVNTHKEVTVVGTANRESDLSARHSEQKADNTMNIMSSQSIQLLPDITIANTLARISGVSVERNSSGDGKYAVVRGMNKRYNYTEVNGIKIPSPDNENRFVPLDLFPSDIVERLEVVKSLLPSMEGDAIGGAINMQLRSAPDYLMVRATVAGGMSTIFANKPFKTYNTQPISFLSPDQLHGHDYLANVDEFPKSSLDYTNIDNPINSTANVIVGDRFGKDHKFGALFAGSYQNVFLGSNSLFFEPSAQPAPDQAPGTPNIYENYRGNSPVFDYIHVRQYYTQQTRYAAHAMLDYQFNNLNNISFYNLFVFSRQQQVRTSSDSVLDIQRTGPGSGLVENESRSILTEQSIYTSALQGNHVLLPGLKLDWTATYSLATNHQPDYSTFTTTEGAYKDSAGNERNTPVVVKSESRKWTNNTDQDFAGYLNLTYNTNLFGHEFEVKAGGMDRHKTRDNYYIDYKLSPLIPNGQTSQFFSSFDQAVFYWSPSGEANGEQINTSTYTVTEDITAGYIQAKYLFFGRLQLLTGVRVELTNQSYKELTEPAASFVGLTGQKNYYDVLPGIHLKYIINSKQNLRASYYQSITRPSFFEITPYSMPGDQFDIQGNPLLKHVTADNYDIRYEWFPKGRDNLMVGAFYKTIYDPIEMGFVRTGASAQSLTPVNDSTATNYGFELSFTKFFWNNFGLSGNYTFTNSTIVRKKLLYYRTAPDAEGKTQLNTMTINETGPLEGQSAHIGNLSLIYANTMLGLDAQLAFAYTGKHIVYVSSYYGLDYWQRATTQLDFSAEKKIGKKFSVYVKLTNLLNTPTIVEIEQPNSFRSGRYILPGQDSNSAITVQQDFYRPTYLAGVRFKL